jgi:hypothetical protein
MVNQKDIFLDQRRRGPRAGSLKAELGMERGVGGCWLRNHRTRVRRLRESGNGQRFIGQCSGSIPEAPAAPLLSPSPTNAARSSDRGQTSHPTGSGNGGAKPQTPDGSGGQGDRGGKRGTRRGGAGQGPAGQEQGMERGLAWHGRARQGPWAERREIIESRALGEGADGGVEGHAGMPSAEYALIKPWRSL